SVGEQFRPFQRGSAQFGISGLVHYPVQEWLAVRAAYQFSRTIQEGNAFRNHFSWINLPLSILVEKPGESSFRPFFQFGFTPGLNFDARHARGGENTDIRDVTREFRFEWMAGIGLRVKTLWGITGRKCSK
ncbi:MAG: hypothetical protein AAF206_06805, partial [Bacteroidota bacterium]